MGQKVNPKGFRLISNHDWDSRWFSSDKKQYRDQLASDMKVRDIVTKQTGPQAAVSRVLIERTADIVKVKIFTGRPGMLIGRSGKGIETLTNEIKKVVSGRVEIDVVENRKPELSAAIVAQNIGSQISRRVAYRRAVKMAIQKVMQSGALGVKVNVAGRLNGAEIARSEKFSEGVVPVSSIKENIDYYIYHANTTYGIIGIKVWIYKRVDKEKA